MKLYLKILESRRLKFIHSIKKKKHDHRSYLKMNIYRINILFILTKLFTVHLIRISRMQSCKMYCLVS